MGLDVSHDCWSGAYSGFMRWRRFLAKTIDIPLDLMKGFTDDGSTGKSWDEIPRDDLHILLNHSDCDGDISVKDAKLLLARMESHRITFERFDNSEDKVFTYKYDRWIEGLKLAIESDEIVEFF